MIFGTVCSGIGAPEVAWKGLGWRGAWVSEIEPFPSAVLAAHGHGPNYGDFTKIRRKGGPDAADIDLLCGGTPCQSFSVAGLRKGLDDPRGNLALEFLALSDRFRPRWVVWENVPGVLSSWSCPEPPSDLEADEWEVAETSDFGCFLGGLGELGYGWAYRVLDAQFFGVPQRRRRVFAVGYLGDWRRAVAVLFERAGLSGHPAPRREAGQDTAPTLSARPTGGGGLGTDFDCDGGLVSKALNAHGGSGRMDGESETFVAHALRGEGFDASEDGTGRGTPIIPTLKNKHNPADDGSGIVCDTLRGHPRPGSNSLGAIAIQERAVSENPENGPQGKGYQEDCAFTLEARNKVQAVAFGVDGGETGYSLRATPSHSGDKGDGGETGYSLRATPSHSGDKGDGGVNTTLAAQNASVRRLTPRECERLQGFPDDYTLIEYRGKPACDGPRYKALGNSMAVPVMRWIGERIAFVDAIKEKVGAA